MAHTPVPLALGLDAELLDGMREMFDLLGMELTIAGETMISNRMAKGASAGEEHCAKWRCLPSHTQPTTICWSAARFEPGSARYAIEVIRELEKLRDAGEVGAEPFERDMRALWALTEKRATQHSLLRTFFRIPLAAQRPRLASRGSAWRHGIRGLILALGAFKGC